MPVHTWSYIYYQCCVCGCKNRVLVAFPTWNGPFRARLHNCVRCDAELMITDPHIYDDDGNIVGKKKGGEPNAGNQD